MTTRRIDIVLSLRVRIGALDFFAACALNTIASVAFRAIEGSVCQAQEFGGCHRRGRRDGCNARANRQAIGNMRGARNGKTPDTPA